jgi:hypothetical protein
MCILLIKSLWKQRVVWRSGLPEHREISSGARADTCVGAGLGASVPVHREFVHNGVFFAIACLCSSDGFYSQVIVVSALEGFKLLNGLIGFVVHKGRII